MTGFTIYNGKKRRKINGSSDYNEILTIVNGSVNYSDRRLLMGLAINIVL
jgi:hypothetical protein